MSRRFDTLLRIALMGVVICVPVSVAAYLFSEREARPPPMIAALGLQVSGVNATDAASIGPDPLLMGVLHTNGVALVDSGGTAVAIEDGSYAYVGGESITMRPGAMGILELHGGGTVYLCPGSRASVFAGPGGGPALSLSSGTGRVVFPASTPFEVRTRDAVLRPVPGDDAPRVAEIKALDTGGGFLCGFSSGAFDVSSAPAPNGPPPAATRVDGGGILTLSATGPGALDIQTTPMPSDVAANVTSPAAEGRGTTAYLCRCEELKRYADAMGVPALAMAPVVEPPAAEPDGLQVPDVAPEVPPPDGPPAVLAEPGNPNSTESSSLLPPAAFNPTPELVIPPPLIPPPRLGAGGLASQS